MGGEIIAEKFALLKSRGGNGVSCTYIVEDTLHGQRAVVKVSDKLDHLGLEYLKTINLARESGVPGILLPFESGFLEEEPGCYLAFPELGEPSLENYLRMGAPITCREIIGIIGEILHILETLHGCGMFHLFINTRNVFYRPRHGIMLKDPALKQDYFHPFLELVATPDFYYFSPGVMDGGMPGAEADLYALGKLAERLLGEAVDAGVSGDEPAALRLAARCCSAGSGSAVLSAAQLLLESGEMKEALEQNEPVHRAAAPERIAGGDGAFGPQVRSGGSRPGGANGGIGSTTGRKGSRAIFSLALLLFLALGAAFAVSFSGEEERAPALDRGGGSEVGEDTAPRASLVAMDRPVEEAPGPEGGRGPLEDLVIESAAGRDPSGDGYAPGGPRETGENGAPADPLPPDPSPAPPVASFSLSPGEGQSPLRVYLDASSSHDPDGSIVSYRWSCGGSGKCLYHVFESNVIPAVVPITLTVTDNGGHSSSATRYVTLY